MPFSHTATSQIPSRWWKQWYGMITSQYSFPDFGIMITLDSTKWEMIKFKTRISKSKMDCVTVDQSFLKGLAPIESGLGIHSGWQEILDWISANSKGKGGSDRDQARYSVMKFLITLAQVNILSQSQMLDAFCDIFFRLSPYEFYRAIILFCLWCHWYIAERPSCSPVLPWTS